MNQAAHEAAGLPAVATGPLAEAGTMMHQLPSPYIAPGWAMLSDQVTSLQECGAVRLAAGVTMELAPARSHGQVPSMPTLVLPSLAPLGRSPQSGVSFCALGQGSGDL